MSDLPVMLRVAGRRCVIVGGGAVALRRALTLVDAGAAVTVIAPRIAPEIEGLPGVTLIPRVYESGDLKGAILVVVATDQPEVNRQVADDAARVGVLTNRADDPDAGDIAIPAHARHGPVTIAVHTSGISATAAAAIRRELSVALDPQWPALLSIAAPYRDRIQAQFADPQARREALARLAGPEARDVLRRQGEEGLRSFCENILAGAPAAPPTRRI